jgi:hypothetical protein
MEDSIRFRSMPPTEQAAAIRRLIALGLDARAISRATGLAVEQVRALDPAPSTQTDSGRPSSGL